MKAYELLQTEGLISASPGKGYYVNAQNSEMLLEQHIRRVEDSLLDAIKSAKIAGLGNSELIEMLKTLLSIE